MYTNLNAQSGSLAASASMSGSLTVTGPGGGSITASGAASGSLSASWSDVDCAQPRFDPAALRQRFQDLLQPYCPEPHPPPPPAEPTLKVDPETDKVTTPGGYVIEPVDQYSWKVTGPDGKETLVWGDPHVKESDGGAWDFKDDSTFVLPDGTKINVDTKPLENGTTVTSSIEIVNGDSRVEIAGIDQGKGQTGALTQSGQVYDTTGNDQFVMGAETDDWYLADREIVGSEDNGAVLKLGDKRPEEAVVAGAAAVESGAYGQVEQQVTSQPGGASLKAAFQDLALAFQQAMSQLHLSSSASASASASASIPA